MHRSFVQAFEMLSAFDGDSADFYEKWWSGERGNVTVAATPTTFHPSLPAIRIGETDHHFTFSTGTQAIRVEVGEFLWTDDSRALICRRHRWSNSHWNWIQSNKIERHPKSEKEFRIYVPSASLAIIDLVESILSSLEAANLQFKMKYRRSEGVFSDAVVIWVDDVYLVSAVCAILKVTRSLAMLRVPPPLTKWIDCIGVAEHPIDGSSLGDKYSRTLWTISKTAKPEEYELKISSQGLNLESPWLLNPKVGREDWEALLESLD